MFCKIWVFVFHVILIGEMIFYHFVKYFSWITWNKHWKTKLIFLYLFLWDTRNGTKTGYCNCASGDPWPAIEGLIRSKSNEKIECWALWVASRPSPRPKAGDGNWGQSFHLEKGDHRTKMRLMLRWLKRFVSFSFDFPSLIQKKSQVKQRTISKEQFNRSIYEIWKIINYFSSIALY